MALKSRVRLCNSIDKSLFEKLQRLSKETMIPMSKLLDKAIEKLLEEYGKLR
jgi:predicted DNA-binding protein